MSERGDVVDYRLENKNNHLNAKRAELIRQSKRDFSTVKKTVYPKPETLHDTKG